jgi:hypothetical protein
MTKYQQFKDKVLKQLESAIQNGCDNSGEFPIIIGEYYLPPIGFRNEETDKFDVWEICIDRIVAKPNYNLSDNQKIEVIITDFNTGEKTIEVTPDLSNIQTLSTYLSGGWDCYNDNGETINLHTEFYELRDEIWKELEKVVHGGVKLSVWEDPQNFPIINGEYSLSKKGLRDIGAILTDTAIIEILGIVADDDFCLFPSVKDIVVTTNKIKVIVERTSQKNQITYEFEVEVEPDILDLETISFFLDNCGK